MRRRRQRGSSVLYVIVLSPIIFLSLALALEAGALQMQKERIRSAVGMATINAASVGATVQNGPGFSQAATENAARLSLEDNLEPLREQFVGETPASLAAAADVFVVTDVPSNDPLGSGVVERPTVEIRLHVPVRSGLLSAAGLPPTLTLTVSASADLRIRGGDLP